MTRRPAEVLPTREARKHLTTFLKVSRLQGAATDPVFFGAYRKPEAVVLSIETYEDLLDALDDVAIAREVVTRDASDSGKRLELAELIRSQGFDPAEFGV